MQSIFSAGASAAAIPIWFVTATTYKDVRERLGAAARAFADAAGFEPKPGQYLALPGEGGLSGILFGLENGGDAKDLFLPGRLPQQLPGGVYRFANDPHDTRLAALAFALGAYRFTRYHKSEGRKIKLDLPQSLDREELEHVVEAVTLVRDLVNTPANDMGPPELEDAARTLAGKHGAHVNSTVGDDLLRDNFPLIHAVGRAAARPPRLIDLTWGEADHPRVTLVGKGVCFDSGGLDIKPESSMLNMKKDMGGAATALALAHMIMSRKLRLRLRVMIPAVENSISGAAFRPRDIYTSRKGITVEIGNTDAEGRLILADALTLADEDDPELIFDFATLTGAARVALGPDVPPFFTDDDQLADKPDGACRRRERSACGGCRSGGRMTKCWNPRSPTSTMSAAADRPAPSRRRCSCAALSARNRGRISTCSPGARAAGPAGRKAASARRRARSMRCSPRATADRPRCPRSIRA